jgi:small subunit ribosomal protein S1
MTDTPVNDRPDIENAEGNPAGENEAPPELRPEEDFARLYEESIEVPEEGQSLHGTVIKVLKDYVAVDINRKSEGMLPIDDIPPEEAATLGPGDRIDVMVERYDQSQGFVLLSRSKVLKNRVWDDLQKVFDEEGAVEGTITARVKGGYQVDVGVRAFLPGSQVDLRPVKDPESVVGLTDKFRILKFSRKKANVVVSRRAWLEAERDSHRAGLMDRLAEGDVVAAKVKNITDYGVFMDLGGLDGLMHITDMSYGKVGNPADVIKVGDEVTVKVIRFDREKGRISLGMKQLKEDPWTDIGTRYREGQKVTGRVTNTAKYGAFLEIEEGVEGLLHISEMSWNRKLKDGGEVMKPGDRVEVVILKIDTENRKVSLGYRQLLPNPWDELKSRHPEGSVVEGTVKNVTDFGLFVDIGEEIDGLVHVSDLSWNQKVKSPSDVAKKGDTVRARVLKIDPASQKFSLGVKQLTGDPWEELAATIRKGSHVTGKVSRLADFGAFVELAPGIDGLVHVSEIAREKVESPAAVLTPGEEVHAVVLGVDRGSRRISLSIKALVEEQERKSMESYLAEAQPKSPEGLGSLGEALRAAQRSKNGAE